MELSTYETDAVRLEVPAGFTDRSIQLFYPPRPKDRGFSYTVSREARSDDSLVDQAEAIIAKLQSNLPGVRILGRRERALGALPAYEMRLYAKLDGRSLYQRTAFVDHYGTMVTYTVTAPRGQKQQGDTLAERWFDSLRFLEKDA